MSSSSYPNVSFLQFQDIFSAALREYSQKTGKDIATDPLAVRFLNCNSSAAVLDILEEQARAFDHFRKGDKKTQLMRRLKPIVDILLGISTTDIIVEGISLVRIPRTNYILRKFIDYRPPLRSFHQRMRYLPVLVFYSLFVSPPRRCLQS